MEKCPGWGGHLALGLITDLLPTGVPVSTPPPPPQIGASICFLKERSRTWREVAGSCCFILLDGSYGQEQRERSPRKETPASSLEIGFEASHTWVQTLPLPFIYQQHDHEKLTGRCASLMSKEGTTQCEAAPRPENVPLTVPKCSRVHAGGKRKGLSVRVGLGPSTLLRKVWDSWGWGSWL